MPGFVIVGVTNMPEFGILPTTEPRHTGPTLQPVGPLEDAGRLVGRLGRRRGRRHGADRPRQRRRRLHPHPGRLHGPRRPEAQPRPVSRGPDLGDSFLVSDGVLSRTVGETAQLLDVLAGYEVGDATWAPRPAEPYSTSVRRDPGRLRVAMTAANPLDVDVDPECVHGMHQAAELLSSLGHEVEEADPGMPGRDALQLFIAAFGPAVSTGHQLRRAARRAEADRGRDRAAVAGDPRAGAGDHVGRLPAGGRAAPGARARARGVLRRLRPAAHARARRAAAGDRRVPRLRRGPDGRPRALRPLHAVHRRCSTSRGSRRSRCRSASARTGCRPTCRSSASRSARTRCSRSPGRSRPPGRGPSTARPSPKARAQHLGHPVRRHAERLEVRGAAGGEHRHGEHQRLVPGRERGRAGQRLAGVEQPARSAASGTGTRRRRRPAARSASSTTSRWVRVSGPASSNRSRAAARPIERGEHGRCRVVGPQRLRAGAAAAGERHGGQPGEALEPAPAAGRPGA